MPVAAIVRIHTLEAPVVALTTVLALTVCTDHARNQGQVCTMIVILSETKEYGFQRIRPSARAVLDALFCGSRFSMTAYSYSFHIA